MKIELVDGWKKSYKFSSMIFSAIGTFLMGVFAVWPDSALYLWGAMPSEVKNFLPQNIVPFIAMFIFIMSMVSRLIKQRKLDNEIKSK